MSRAKAPIELPSDRRRFEYDDRPFLAELLREDGGCLGCAVEEEHVRLRSRCKRSGRLFVQCSVLRESTTTVSASEVEPMAFLADLVQDNRRPSSAPELKIIDVDTVLP